MKRLKGVGASGGVAIGLLRYYDNAAQKILQAHTTDPKKEQQRFEQARQQAVKMLKKLYVRALCEVGKDESTIFEIHQMMLSDQDFINSVNTMIDKENYVAEYAVQQAGGYLEQMISCVEDSYIKERGADVKDICNRLIRILCGQKSNNPSKLGGQFIIAAGDLMPSETIQLDQTKVLAFITYTGSKVSHSAILARKMRIPAVVGLGDAYDQLNDNETVIVDGTQGVVIIDPDERTLEEYRSKRRDMILHRERLITLKGMPSRTKDGIDIGIWASIRHPFQVSDVLENDGDGIGLMRSEFLYTESDTLPDEQTQYEAYKNVLISMKGKYVNVRTLDLGSNKNNSSMDRPPEINPAMGYRGIRASLRQPQIFRTQIRALLRASVYGKLTIMFPLVNYIGEIRSAKAILHDCEEELSTQGIPYDNKILIGAVIETPAAALMAGTFAKELDFLTIGTNDLTQYTLAVDRMNGSLGSMYDTRHPALLRLIEMAASAAARHRIPCSVSGVCASDTKLTESLLSMGVTAFVVAPNDILEIREKVRSIDLGYRKGI